MGIVITAELCGFLLAIAEEVCNTDALFVVFAPIVGGEIFGHFYPLATLIVVTFVETPLAEDSGVGRSTGLFYALQEPLELALYRNTVI